MRHRALLAAILASSPWAATAPAADPPRKVLVELYTSQGCDSCPPAADLVGRLPALGFGPDRVIPLNFHVDYFNTPWEDPFSDASYSERELSYNRVLKRTDLYFTPMMMVDGRRPLLGSNRAEAVAAIKAAKAEPAAVALDLALDGAGARRTLALRAAALSPRAAGRDLLIGVAVVQDRASTRVPSGENAGKTLVEHAVVRRLDHRFVKLDRATPTTLAFPVELPPGADPGGSRVVAFAQDRADGRVHQAEAIRWPAATTVPAAGSPSSTSTPGGPAAAAAGPPR